MSEAGSLTSFYRSAFRKTGLHSPSKLPRGGTRRARRNHKRSLCFPGGGRWSTSHKFLLLLLLHASFMESAEEAANILSSKRVIFQSFSFNMYMHRKTQECVLNPQILQNRYSVSYHLLKMKVPTCPKVTNLAFSNASV